MKRGVKPAAEVRGAFVIDKLGCVFRDKCLQIFLRWEAIVLVIVVFLKYHKLGLFQGFLSDIFRPLHAEDLEEIGDFFAVGCPPIRSTIRITTMLETYLKI